MPIPVSNQQITSKIAFSHIGWDLRWQPKHSRLFLSLFPLLPHIIQEPKFSKVKRTQTVSSLNTSKTQRSPSISHASTSTRHPYYLTDSNPKLLQKMKWWTPVLSLDLIIHLLTHSALLTSNTKSLSQTSILPKNQSTIATSLPHLPNF